MQGGSTPAKVAVLKGKRAVRQGPFRHGAMSDTGALGLSDLSIAALTIVGALATGLCAAPAWQMSVKFPAPRPRRACQEPGGKPPSRGRNLRLCLRYISTLCFIEHSMLPALLIPVARQGPHRTLQSCEEHAQAAMRAREKEFVIAVVDDEAALCQALSNLLRRAGYRVHTFASAEDFGVRGQAQRGLPNPRCAASGYERSGAATAFGGKRLSSPGHLRYGRQGWPKGAGATRRCISLFTQTI
jgi:hypothetical protein